MPTPIQFDSAQPCEGVLNDFFSDEPADRCIDCTRHVPDPRSLPRDTVYLEPTFGRRKRFLVCLDRNSAGQPRPATVFAGNETSVCAVANPKRRIAADAPLFAEVTA